MDPTNRARTSSALLTDLYELTMAQSYLAEGMTAPATFSLFVRTMPPNRGYLIAAGLEDALSYLEGFRFTGEDLELLAAMRIFSTALLDCLRTLRFSGSVRAMPEGTVCFAEEPILEVTAPIIEAQLVETMLLNEIQLQTLVATKAARCVDAAAGRRVVDFSLRRTHGGEAGLKVARASYLGGCEATSNVLGANVYGIPAAGTMAHSYVEAFPEELAAFRAYAAAFPDRAILLLDTYDTMEGARNAAIVGSELAAAGHVLAGVRLDSGDFATLSREVRAILDAADLRQTTIFASGGLDEYAIEELVAADAPIDGYGVGTRLGVSADAPHMDVAYKLVSYAGRPTMKLSEGKVSWPGAKQVWRRTGVDGIEDQLGLAEETPLAGFEPLLIEVMRDGQRVQPTESLNGMQARAREQRKGLLTFARRLRQPVALGPTPTDGLRQLRDSIRPPTAAVEAHS